MRLLRKLRHSTRIQTQNEPLPVNRPSRLRSVTPYLKKGGTFLAKIVLKPAHWLYLLLNRYFPGFKKLPDGTQQYGSVAIIAALYLFIGGFILVQLFGLGPPFPDADIYPTSDPKMTAGTITVAAAKQDAVFTITTGKKSFLSFNSNVQLVKTAYAQDTPSSTAKYKYDGVDVTTEVKDSTGQLATNIAVSLEKNGADLALNVHQKDPNQLSPGVYRIYTTFTEGRKTRTITQDFAWGVLAINSLKSIYTPNETAKFHFGVLDEEGNTLCNALLNLEITTPSGQVDARASGVGITNSATCNGNTAESEPDYAAEYPVKEVGTYKLKLTAETQNGKFFIDDTLVVKESVPFDVERVKYPTRIFPEAVYNTTTVVKANHDFSGEITETVPKSFAIGAESNESVFTKVVRKHLGTDTLLSTPEPVIAEKDGSQTITWKVEMKAGESMNLYYAIKFPEVSPEFYLVGPLTFTSKDGKEVFAETRQWQIASDSVIVSTGITSAETQFGGNQRKVVFVNSNWYAFYNDGADVWYKKSANGITWGSAVDVDNADADNYNPTVDVSGNTIIAFWIDDSAETIQGRTIDTASSDAQGTLCTGASQGTIGSTFFPTIAATSTTAAVVAYSDSSSDTEVDIFNVTGLSGSCTATDVSPGNMAQFSSGITAGDRPTLVGVDSTHVAMIFQDGNLSYSLFNVEGLDWTDNNITLAAVTDTTYSVVTDATSIWVLSQDATAGSRLYKCCTADIAETQIDSDAGANDDDGDADIDMFCPTEDNCKIVYSENIDTTSPDLVFVDCNDTNCSSPTSSTLDTDLGTTNDMANASIFCITDGTSVGGNCKIAYGDDLESNNGDVTLIDCTNDEDCSTNTQTDLDADISSTTNTAQPHTATYCPSDTNCKVLFNDEGARTLNFVDCNDATCTAPTTSAIDTQYGVVGVASIHMDLYCVASDNCKFVYQDNSATAGCADANSLCFVDCTADEDCSTNTKTVVDSDMGTTQGAPPVGIDCVGGDTDCKVVYGDGTAGDLFFVDCGAAVCDGTGRTITQIDAAGGADTTLFEKASISCPSANDCHLFYAGDLTSGTEDAYFVDCDDATCTTGSTLDLPGPRFGGAIVCLTGSNCKLTYYDGTSATNPTVQFADCDTDECGPTWSTLTAPWTSESNVSGLSLTYDSSNSDLIASIIKDASETVYFNTSDATTISWGGSTASDGFGAVGDMDNVSTPETAAGTSQMAAVARQTANFEFDFIAAATVIPTQNHFRFRDDTTALNTDGGYLATEDSALTPTTITPTTYRLRLEIANTGTGSVTNYNYRLEYALKSSTCAAASYTTVPASPTSEAFEMVLSGQYADAAAISASRLTATGTFVNGIAVEDSSNSTGNHTLASGEYSEFEYAISPTANVVSGSSYCFRVTNAGSTTNFVYSTYPEITFVVPGLSTYWKFDEGYGSTTEDTSRLNLDGTLNNTPTWQTENMCVAGKCLYFNGTANMNVSRADTGAQDFAAADNFTVSAWVKRNGASSAINYILSKADTTTGGYKLWMDDTGDLCFGIDDDTTWGTPDDSACTSAVDFDDDKWHFVTGVKAATTSITLYVDGNQRAQDATIAATGTLANSGTFYAGVDSDGTSNEWLGFIDEVKVFRDTVARTAAQVKADYNARSTVDGDGVGSAEGNNNQNLVGALSNGLVGYWKMDEGTSTTANDSSGNTNTGTLTNTPTWGAGKFGYATSFAGSNQHINAGSGSSLDDLPALTVSAWIYPTTISGDHVIARKGTSGNGWIFYQNANVLRAQVDCSGGAHESATDNVITIAANIWQHVVVTWDGSCSSNSTFKFYINAVSLGNTYPSSGSGTYVSDAAQALRIGIDGDAVSSDFVGGIDDLRIYRRTLSSAEISQLYNWAPGPIGYWKMDEPLWNATSGEVKDSSGNAYNGTGNDGATTNTGKYGRGGIFDGTDDDVSIASNLMGSPKNFTVSAWVNMTARDTTGAAIVSVGDYFGINGDSNNCTGPEVFYYEGSSSWLPSCSATTIEDTGWHHIAGTFDDVANVQKLYVDGVLKDNDTYSNSISYSGLGTGTIFGAHGAGGTDQDYGGKIDEVRVYNYVRTDAQIVEDMNAAHPAPGSPVGSPVVYWKFDPPTGVTVYDSNTATGGAENATLLSATAYTTAGKFGAAFIGNGTNYGGVADDADTDFLGSESFSASMWVQSASASNPGAVQWLLNKYHAGVNAAGYALYYNTSGQLCFGIDDDATWTPDVESCTTTDYYDAAWHHVTAVRDTNTDKTYIYVDSKEKDNDTDSTTGTLANAAALLFGDSDGSDGTQEFVGNIDEIKLFRSALTPTQIALETNRGSTQALGSLSSSQSNPNSAAAEYCIPGDATTCTSPLGRWDLEEGNGSSANDSSGNSNTGTNTSTTYVVGKVGKGLSFDSATTSRVTTAIATHPSTFTIEAWVYSTSNSGIDTVISKDTSGGSKDGFFMRADSGNFDCGVMTAGADTFSNVPSRPTNTLNTWVHQVCSYDGTTVRYYKNGILTATGTGSMDTSTGTFTIGSGYSGASESFDGKIDQVRYFNYARTASQIAWDYNKAGPIAYWKLDECTGTTLNDSSGNGYAGTLTIGATDVSTAGTCSTSGAWFNGATGKRNYSISLDGDDDRIRATLTNSVPTTDFTYAAWVNTASTTSYRQFYQVEGGTTGDGDAIAIFFTNGDDTISYRVDGGSTVTSTQSIPINQWHHVVLTRAGSAVSLYINGKLDPSGSSSNGGALTINASCHTVYIGVDQTDGCDESGGTYAGWFDGKLDDMRVYGYGLNATQVKTLYNDGASRYGPNTGAP